jgi:anti-sigma-K factor RskA
MSIDLHTLSGAYAIDALSAEEAREFVKHLEECEACRDEVRELQSAAATLGASEAAAPPPALRARVLDAADQLPQMPPKVVAIDRARSRRWTARLASAAAAVVLVVGTGFGISQLRDDDQPPVMAASVAQVFKAQDAKTETVDTSNGGKVTVATSEQLGRMALETHELPALSDRQVYQLWAIHNGSPTSAGVVDNLAVGKAMAMPSDRSTVAITIEPSGGSDQPTTKPIVTVDPTKV